MQIIIANYPSVKSYRDNFTKILAIAPRVCPHCGGRLKGHGRRKRWIICSEGTIRISIQRMLCIACRKTFSLLPRIFQARRACVRSLLWQILSLWDIGKIKMSTVRYQMLKAYPALILPLATLYRWAGHTS